MTDKSKKDYFVVILSFSVVVLFQSQYYCTESSNELIEEIMPALSQPFCAIAASKPEPQEINNSVSTRPITSSPSFAASATLSTIGTSQLIGPSPSPSEF